MVLLLRTSLLLIGWQCSAFCGSIIALLHITIALHRTPHCINTTARMLANRVAQQSLRRREYTGPSLMPYSWLTTAQWEQRGSPVQRR
jgi:hypothetical protein